MMTTTTFPPPLFESYHHPSSRGYGRSEPLHEDNADLSLIYSDEIKERLLHYIHSTTAFSDAEVDFNVVTWNR